MSFSLFLRSVRKVKLKEMSDQNYLPLIVVLEIEFALEIDLYYLVAVHVVDSLNRQPSFFIWHLESG